MDQHVTRRTVMQTLTVGGLTVALSGCETIPTDENEPSPTTTPTQTGSPMPDQQGPMRAGRFTVEIDDVEVAGFAHVTIPSTKIADGSSDGDSEYEKKTWGQSSHSDLVLERALRKGDSTLREWRDQIVQGKVESGTKNVAVNLEDEDGNVEIRWEFTGAWITEYEPPELIADSADDADAQGEVPTETIRVAFEGMQRPQG